MMWRRRERTCLAGCGKPAGVVGAYAYSKRREFCSDECREEWLDTMNQL